MIAAAGGGLLPSIVAKGDLYAGSAPNTVGLLSVGTSGQVLSADPASAVGLRWADAAGGTVSSVNGKTGIVVLSPSDIGAEPVIIAGNAAQYRRGDKTWQTLDKASVGLGSVDNTSDATKFASPTLSGTVTASGRFVITPDALTVSAGAVATDVSQGNHFEFTANANFTLSNPTNPSHGQRVMWAITQDATGSRIMTLGSMFIFGTDITSATLSTAGGKTDLLGAMYDSVSAKWRICMFIRGF
jgi:hypothetical protein